MARENDNELANIKDIKIDTSLPIEKRIEAYLNQIKNPYQFTNGKVDITVRYNENGATLRELLTNYFIQNKTE